MNDQTEPRVSVVGVNGALTGASIMADIQAMRDYFMNRGQKVIIVVDIPKPDPFENADSVVLKAAMECFPLVSKSLTCRKCGGRKYGKNGAPCTTCHGHGKIECD